MSDPIPERPPALQAVDSTPPGHCHVDPNPETLSARRHDRPEELEPTNAGVGVQSRDLVFWLWGFARDTGELGQDHALCLRALRRALDRLPKGSFNVGVYAGTSVRFAERWAGCGVDALADTRVQAVRSALGLDPAKPGMHTMLDDVPQQAPISSGDDPSGVARRRIVSCSFHLDMGLKWRGYHLDTVSAQPLELGPIHTLLRTTDVGELFVGEHVGGPAIRELLRRQRSTLAYMLAPAWIRPYPRWASGVDRMLCRHYDARDEAGKRRVRQVQRVTSNFGFRCDVLARLRCLFGGIGLGELKPRLAPGLVACFELLEVEGPLDRRLRELARRLRDIDLDSDLGPALAPAIAEAGTELSTPDVRPAWAEFYSAVARPQLSDITPSKQ